LPAQKLPASSAHPLSGARRKIEPPTSKPRASQICLPITVIIHIKEVNDTFRPSFMTLKIFVPACAVVALVAFRSLEATRSLDKLESSFSKAGLADFSPEAIKNASAETLGEMLQIASAGLPRDSEVKVVAESLARKRHAGREWTQRFVQAYHDKQQHALDAR
jgi:hypothetical protein